MANSTTDGTNGTNGTLVDNVTTLSTWSISETTTDSYFTTTDPGDIHLLVPTMNYSKYSLETYTTIYWSVSASSLMLVLLACICLQTYVYRKGKNKIYAGLTREKTMAIKTSVEIEEDEDLCVWSVKILVEIERPLLVDVFKWAGVCAFCTGLLLAIPARYALIPLLLYDVSQAIHVCVLYVKKMENKDKDAVFQDVKRVHLSYTLFAGFPAGSVAKILGTLWLDGIWDSWGYSDFGFTILFAPHTILIFIAAPIVFFTFCCACCKCSESEPCKDRKFLLICCLLYVIFSLLWLIGVVLMISSSPYDIHGIVHQISAAIYTIIVQAINMNLPWALGFAFVFGAFFLYAMTLFLYVANNGRLLKVIPEFSDAWCFGWSSVILVYFLDNPGDVSSLSFKVYAMLPLLFSCLIGLTYDVYRIFRMARKRQKLLEKRKIQQDEANQVTEMEVQAPDYWVNFQDDFKKCAGEEGRVMLVEIGGQIRKEVKHMMKKSWSKEKMLIHGRDSVGLHHTDFRITKVERVENPRLWSQYFCKLQDISRKCARNPIDRAPWMHAYTYQLSGILNERLRNELNEYYFFHGTNTNVAETICATGLDFRIGNEGLFGKGIYLAENSSKSDQYAWLSATDRGTKGLKMFLVRACIGRPYLTREKKQFPRPPCTEKGCMQVVCNHTSHFDSVIADVSNMLYREFIIYEKTMCYPEYIITYDRI
ncbi:uncharacterized protein LOC106162518 [Lingula anatina]|uniref:Poly [ADP-ribose] polymerase n=1 Tax=Lingula anatina TaxID=7574 RepID=A0A1S3IAT4_LINAN|nr:uncharacterized protein LOC106162518 [Lingula anatina]|eukprot:XP_013395278.1 uncharacterized protein LOC106162518 [Lingula anatina]